MTYAVTCFGVFLDNNLNFITLKCIEFLFWLMSSVIVKKYFFLLRGRKSTILAQKALLVSHTNICDTMLYLYT